MPADTSFRFSSNMLPNCTSFCKDYPEAVSLCIVLLTYVFAASAYTAKKYRQKLADGSAAYTIHLPIQSSSTLQFPPFSVGIRSAFWQKRRI